MTLADILAQLQSRLDRVIRAIAPTDTLGRTNSVAFRIGLAVVLLGLVSGFATYLILTGLTAIQPTNAVVVRLLLVNIAMVLAMAVVVGFEVWRLLKARRNQAAGARLHVRIVALFSLIAVLPAITIAVFASASLNRALDRLFSKGTEQIISNSMSVAEEYLQEHGQVIRADVVPMAKDIDDAAAVFTSNPKQFETVLFGQANLRNLPVAYVIDGSGAIRIAAANPQKLPFNKPSPALLSEATSGDVVMVPPGRTNQVGAIKKLANIPDAYLYVSREVNPKVLNQLRQTQASVLEYRRLEERRAGTQFAFGFMHLQLALTLLLASVWMGMWFANNLVTPIRRLIGAAQKVSEGNLDVRVPYRATEADLAQLSATFNKMTDELRKQRNELVATNSQLNERRRFIEAVLGGVTAGVIGIDDAGMITLVNPSALELLDRTETDLVGHGLPEAIAQFAPALEKAREQEPRERLQEQIEMTVKGAERHFAVQVLREHSANRDYGFVLTFDDVTGLVTAQRSAVWADVARRIAHEIKNPLTPIQLSAERLRRKYSSVIKEDREVFDRCTETIIRQVGDLGRIVDEFSSFARLPKAQMEPQDIRNVVREVVFLFQNGNPDIDFSAAVPGKPLVMLCDRRLIGQAVTNLVKNATEAIQSVRDQDPPEPGFRGHISISIARAGDDAVITVIDNGIGLPKKDRARLIEPYRTTRAKGTGIGLAVVQKVTEQHGGVLKLEDAPITSVRKHGAAVSMVLPIRGAEAAKTVNGNGSAEHAPRLPETAERPQRPPLTGSGQESGRSER